MDMGIETQQAVLGKSDGNVLASWNIDSDGSRYGSSMLCVLINTEIKLNLIHL